jgi:hypothetical protein
MRDLATARPEWLAPGRSALKFGQLGSLHRKDESLVISTKLRMAKTMPFMPSRFLSLDEWLYRSTVKRSVPFVHSSLPHRGVAFRRRDSPSSSFS